MKAGYVSLVGRPNAGKSTLLNRIVGQKLAIVSDKPQTTRTRVLGVKNYPEGQVVFVDTPGIHKPTHRMNVRMVDAALEAMRDVDVVALVVDAGARPGRGDRHLLELVKAIEAPVVLALTKVDLVAKPSLLPLIDQYRRAHAFVAFVPVSAVDGTNIEALERVCLEHLPEGDPIYPSEYLTDRTGRFFASEIVREQVLRHTHDELPFSTAVVVDNFTEAGTGLLELYCTILVERPSQKAIVVGRSGEMIKTIGTAARTELERHFERRVFLDLHVKVKAEWREDDRTLDDLDSRATTE
jgi:GTP-binding protein Era